MSQTATEQNIDLNPSPNMQVMDFNEILKGASARMTQINGKKYVSAIDVIMVLSQKDNNQSAEIFRKLDQYDRDELQPHLTNTRFPGRGQRETPVVDMEGALMLVEFLKFERAKKYRKQFRAIIRRYMAGDETMHAEIQQNAQSNAPLNVMARESVQEDAGTNQTLQVPTRTKEQIGWEMQLLDHDLKVKHQIMELQEQYKIKEEKRAMQQRKRMNEDDLKHMQKRAAVEKSIAENELQRFKARAEIEVSLQEKLAAINKNKLADETIHCERQALAMQKKREEAESFKKISMSTPNVHPAPAPVPTAPVAPPAVLPADLAAYNDYITVSRVAKHFLGDKMQVLLPKTRDTILRLAGRKAATRFQPLNRKVQSAYNAFTEHCYGVEHLGDIVNLVQEFYTTETRAVQAMQSYVHKV